MMNLIVSKKTAGFTLACMMLAASPVQATPTQRNCAIVSAGAAALLINSLVASYKNGTSLPAEFKRSIATFKEKIAQSLSRSKESTRSVATLSAADKYSAGIVAVTAAALLGLTVKDLCTQALVQPDPQQPPPQFAGMIYSGGPAQAPVTTLALRPNSSSPVQELAAQRQNAAAAAQVVPMPEAIEADETNEGDEIEQPGALQHKGRRLEIIEEKRPSNFRLVFLPQGLSDESISFVRRLAAGDNLPRQLSLPQATSTALVLSPKPSVPTMEQIFKALPREMVKREMVKSTELPLAPAALQILPEQARQAEPAQQAQLAEQANVNAPGEDGYTALIRAALKGHTKTVQALLAAPGINVNAAGPDGDTALINAAFAGHTKTVQALLATRGIDVNAAGRDGDTALSLATEYGYNEIVALLRAAGAH